MATTLRTLLSTPLVAFNYVLPATVHVIAPATVPRRFLRALSLGTNFIPTDHRFVREGISTSLNAFEKRLAWTQHFGLPIVGEQYPLFKLKQGSSPPKLNKATTDYLKDVKNKLEKALSHTHSKRGSHFVKEIEHVQKWAAGKFIIKPADKNLGLTVMTLETYKRLCNEYLTANTKQIETPADVQVERLKNIATRTILDFSHCIDAGVKDYLLAKEKEACNLASFYILPKMHKQPVGARPIVAAHSCPFTPLSKWLSKVLHPCVARLDQFLRDSSELTQILTQTTFPRDCVLVTFDVESMYPNMDKDIAIEGVIFTLSKSYPRKHPTWAQLAFSIIEALFERCYFVFDDKIYHQSKGIAMGTASAPDIANCYLAKLEQQFCNEMGKSKVFIYKRFIDDGFAVVDSIETANSMINLLQHKSGLKLTFDISAEEATFLDLHISKETLFQNTGLLSFRTHRKAMNKFLYLPAFSSHHPASIKSWVFAEILRLRNTTLRDTDFIHSATFFLEQLRKRGYSDTIIHSALDMLPDELFSPFVWRGKQQNLPTLITNSGQAFAPSPPLIFRAPFALQHHIKYGPILYDGFEQFCKGLPRAEVTNPNPTRSHLILANTLAKSLSNRLVKARLSSGKFTKKRN